ncbi:MAG: hypothetical protein LBQ21_01150 [Clostridiales Family XIII bacterium]|jgi:hypothetical protein|nr:hypothetical protein [Clostridiales Family XIII bacterium]
MSKKLNALQKTVSKPVVLLLSLMLVATFIFIPTLVTADESTMPAEIIDEEAAPDPGAVGAEDAEIEAVADDETEEVVAADEAEEAAAEESAQPLIGESASPAKADMPINTLAEEVGTQVTSGFVSLTRNSTQVVFAGKTWWVVGTNFGGPVQGINPTPATASTSTNRATLLLHKDTPYGVSPFRYGQKGAFENSTIEGGWSYANNPGENPGWATINEYKGSTLQVTMAAIADAIANSSGKESGRIITRNSLKEDDNLGPVYGSDSRTAYMMGPDVTDQKFWPLSFQEWSNINNDAVRSFTGDYYSFWLRSTFHYNNGCGIVAYSNGSQFWDNAYIDYDSTGIRPAFILDLDTAIFTSPTSGAISPDEVALQTPVDIASWSAAADPKKITFSDPSLTLSLSPVGTQGVGEDMSLTIGSGSGNVTLSYIKATLGKRISCLLVNKSSSGKSYYENLATDISSSSDTVTLETTGMDAGDYTLQLFTEEVNGADKSNFCSAPAAFESDDADLTTIAGIKIATWSGEGTSGTSPKTASITVAPTKESISLAEIVPAHANAVAMLYTDSGFTTTTGSIDLAAGSASNHVYIAVTAEAGNVLYYKVTVDRPIPGGGDDDNIYPVIKHFGAWTGDGTIDAKIDAPAAKFLALYRGEAQVDPADYKVAEGSTIITLTEDYVKVFPEGTHSFVAAYTDGYSEDIILKVDLTDASTGTDYIDDDTNVGDPSKSGSSDTSDDFGIGLFSGTFILAAAGLIACATARRRLGKHA